MYGKLVRGAAVALVVVAAACDDHLPTTPSSQPLEQPLLKSAAQGGHVFLTWTPIPTADGYELAWRRADAGAWTTIDVADATWRAVTPLDDGVAYEFAVRAWRGDARGPRSEIARATPRERPDCAYPSYMPWYERLGFFCTQEAADRWLRAQGVEPGDLRCRGATVAWNEHAPNCLYVLPDGRQLLLQRLADSRFAPSAPAPLPETVRRFARRAIWGARNPFTQPARFDVGVAPAEPFVGEVRGHAGADGYVVRYDSAVVSRVTWFRSPRPRSRRYAIYHEGHGGYASEIGAATIDYLLAAGWDVIAMDLPLAGVNFADTTRGRRYHDDFTPRERDGGSPVGLFMLPVKAMVDRIVARGDGDPTVLMIGRSGGGWASYVYGALDERVDLVVSVAGGLPMAQRLTLGANDVGDFEQATPTLYDHVGHEELMAAAGSRGALLVYNEMDGCCYRLAPTSTLEPWLEEAGVRSGRTVEVYVEVGGWRHELGIGGQTALERFLDTTAP